MWQHYLFLQCLDFKIAHITWKNNLMRQMTETDIFSPQGLKLIPLDVYVADDLILLK